MKPMYQSKAFSPATTLTNNIGAGDTVIEVDDISVFPEAPNYATIGTVYDDAETIVYNAVDGNTLSGCIRGVEGAARTWNAETAIARNFTAADAEAVRSNIQKVAADLDAHGIAISANTANIAKTTNDLTQETMRATTAENNLQNSKVNRSELTVLITDATFVSGATTAKVTFTAYNAAAQEVGEFERFLPIVSNDAMGVMTPEAYAELQRLRTDVNALQQQGGKFIGISFPTKADLDAYDIPNSVNVGDFTYVLDDETYSDATTRYIYNGTAFQFGFVVNFDPVGLANGDEPGLVKSDGGTTGGKIFVETDGTMSVIGWQSVLNSIAAKVSANNAKISFQINGKDVDNITLNQAVDKTINFSISTSDAELRIKATSDFTAAELPNGAWGGIY